MPRTSHPLRRPRFAGCFGAVAPLLLAGLLPLHPPVSDRWGWSGCWVYPVGDPGTLSGAPSDGVPPYRLMRGVSDQDRGSRHDGADLSNGRGGGPVRAAGNGLVVAVGGKGWNRGYGRHVVLAHRFPDGGLVYSVYAHLAPGSVTVRTGQLVSAGRQIGRVGMTGRATSPHLHFEVRAPEDPSARWENAPAVDPITFVAARQSGPPPDTSWAGPYLAWAECAALIRSGERGDRAMSRMEWWRALAAAGPETPAPLPEDGENLRAALVLAKLLPEATDGDPSAPLGWEEFARDLRQARERGLRLPWSPVGPEPRRRDCNRELGVKSPGRHPETIDERRGGRPSLAVACLALADIAGDAPAAPKAKKRKAAPPKPAAEGPGEAVASTPASPGDAGRTSGSRRF